MRNNPTDYASNIDLITLDELEVRIEEHLTSIIDSLSARWKALSAEIDTCEKYCDNTEKVSAFYQTVVTETEQMCIMIYEYRAVYARMILDSKNPRSATTSQHLLIRYRNNFRRNI